jgi:hypothetical protein
MILITTYYDSKHIERQKEIDCCLLHNIQNQYIDDIYLLNIHIFDLSHLPDPKNKIHQIIISYDSNYQLRYNDAIRYINHHFINKICILSNSDIYFNETLHKINSISLHNRLFALLRYDEDIDGKKHLFSRHNLPRTDSQDSWIFRSPLKIDIHRLDFSMGTLGCDNIFATIVYESNIQISNPCYDIETIHVHRTNYRTYSIENRIHGKYCLLPPCTLTLIPPSPEFMDY